MQKWSKIVKIAKIVKFLRILVIFLVKKMDQICRKTGPVFGRKSKISWKFSQTSRKKDKMIKLNYTSTCEEKACKFQAKRKPFCFDDA